MINYYDTIIKINTLWYKVYIKLRYPNFSYGHNFKIFGRLILSIQKKSKIELGNNIIFSSATKYNFVGINKPVSIFVGKNAELLIGDNSGFSGTSIFVAKKIIIGKYCNFGGNTSIWDNDFHPLNYEDRRVHKINQIKSSPIIIGNDVFVGANSIILKGVSIGDRSIIGAGSVVSKNIPSDEIWAGNPARLIRKVTIV